MVITCSDTRTPDSDTSGQLIQKLLKDQGHSVAAYHLVKDEPEQIKARAAAIEEQAVRTRAMPLGNVTEMTDAEREVLGRWIAQGAKVAP